MKTTSILLLTLLPIGAGAAGQPSLTLWDRKIVWPLLSLGETAKPNPQVIFSYDGSWVPNQNLFGVQAKKLVSYMPIISPSGDIDPKMIIGITDSSIDYKLIVKAPDIESKPIR
jgi:hypothetical protein